MILPINVGVELIIDEALPGTSFTGLASNCYVMYIYVDAPVRFKSEQSEIGIVIDRDRCVDDFSISSIVWIQ